MTDRQPLDFSGQVVLVTGGTRNIGRGIAERFRAAGATVVVCGRHDPGDLDGIGFRACDVRDPDAVGALVDAIVADHGRLDVVVNNAGGSPYAEAATASPRFSEKIVALNLLAPMHVSQAANRVMQAQDGGGVIVNIGSVSGLRPTPGTAAYGAAKAGLVNLTRTLAMEWAPKVRVNMVSGGIIGSDESDSHYGGPEGVARVTSTIPLLRMGEADDIAGACLAMASPLFAFASGANVVLDGGGEWPPHLAAARGGPEEGS